MQSMSEFQFRGRVLSSSESGGNKTIRAKSTRRLTVKEKIKKKATLGGTIKPSSKGNLGSKANIIDGIIADKKLTDAPSNIDSPFGMKKLVRKSSRTIPAKDLEVASPPSQFQFAPQALLKTMTPGP